MSSTYRLDMRVLAHSVKVLGLEENVGDQCTCGGRKQTEATLNQLRNHIDSIAPGSQQAGSKKRFVKGLESNETKPDAIG